ncbi:MAG: hypothetical protein OEV73_08560 [Desulfobulbaceae bacterium]|nr:hypothetical protein [Desulfobulbaceae bacterium]
MSYTIDDSLFVNIKGYIDQTVIDIINASPLLCSLLDNYKNTIGKSIEPYDSTTIGGSYSPGGKTLTFTSETLTPSHTQDFIRLLAHELGHFYDDTQGGLNQFDYGFLDVYNFF